MRHESIFVHALLQAKETAFDNALLMGRIDICFSLDPS